VLEAHRNGVVRSSSLLVTFPDGEEAAELARAERDLEVGLHIDLVGGRPASDPASVPSLVDTEGRFRRLPDFTTRLLTGRIRSAEVAAEVRAQAARARAWGVEPLAWDSHRHTHLIPPITRVVARLAREHRVRYLRRATPPRIAAAVKAQLLGAASLVDRALLRGIPGNDWFVDLSALPRRPDAARIAVHQQLDHQARVIRRKAPLLLVGGVDRRQVQRTALDQIRNEVRQIPPQAPTPQAPAPSTTPAPGHTPETSSPHPRAPA